MAKRRSPNAGLFTGWWTDLEGKRIRRIRRNEFPELYRLHRICSEQEASANALEAHRWLPAEGGYAKISFPGAPLFVESHFV